MNVMNVISAALLQLILFVIFIITAHLYIMIITVNLTFDTFCIVFCINFVMTCNSFLYYLN